MNRLFVQTLRQAPAEAAGAGHRLLLRGGYIAPVSPGNYALLPLGRKVVDRLARRVREGWQALGAQEVLLPDRMPDHGEAVSRLAGRVLQSYRQLPALLYEIAPRWRPESRALEGLPGGRQALIAELHHLELPPPESGAPAPDGPGPAAFGVLGDLLRECGLPVQAAEAAAAAGETATLYFHPDETGAESFWTCPGCGYCAEDRMAACRPLPPEPQPPLPLERVATPGATTIEELCRYLDIPASRTAKAIFLVAGGELLTVVVRGDRELSEARLVGAAGVAAPRPATAEEIRAHGMEPGYGSPIGARDTRIIVDRLAALSPNLVAGANQPGFHLRNVNCGRDYRSDLVADLIRVREGDLCPRCGAPLRAARGTGVAWSIPAGPGRARGAQVQGPQGRYRPLWAGTQAIDLTGLLACLAQEHHDERGPLWPPAAAPFDVAIVDLGRSSGVAETLYAQLQAAGCDVLLDDRADSPGVKFADADLIGAPLRITVGERSLRQGAVELKRRRETEKELVPVDQAVHRVLAERNETPRPPA